MGLRRGSDQPLNALNSPKSSLLLTSQRFRVDLEHVLAQVRRLDPGPADGARGPASLAGRADQSNYELIYRQTPVMGDFLYHPSGSLPDCQDGPTPLRHAKTWAAGAHKLD